MRAVLTLTLALALGGCGHFLTPLGTVQPQAGKTSAEQEIARAECTDESRASVETPAGMARALAMGITVVGAPSEIARLQATRKAVFKRCMQDRGYEVVQGS
jgi:hypothetical protein